MTERKGRAHELFVGKSTLVTIHDDGACPPELRARIDERPVLRPARTGGIVGGKRIGQDVSSFAAT